MSSIISRKKEEIAGLDYGISLAQIGSAICQSQIGMFYGTAAPCVITFQAILVPLQSSKFAIIRELQQKEKEYKENVNGKKAQYQLDLLESTYENVNKNHGNIITIFKQLKLVAENLNAASLRDVEEQNRNLQLQLLDCESTEPGFKELCDKPSCEDKARLCDGSLNYRYLATREGGEFSTAHQLLSNSIINCIIILISLFI